MSRRTVSNATRNAGREYIIKFLDNMAAECDLHLQGDKGRFLS